jgi:type IX secretion system PorP/SprF family membrane protein
MKKTIGLIATAMFLFTGVTYSQNDFYSSTLNYSQQELFTNPAFAGSQDAFSASIDVLKQWFNHTGSPSVQRLQVHSPFFNDKAGLGISFQNESYGVTNRFNISGYYAYRMKLSSGNLALGLQLGYVGVNNSLPHTPVVDPNFVGSKALSGYNAGLGAYYSTDNYYIGLSAPRLIDNSDDGKKMENSMDFEKMPFYLTGGYLFSLDSTFKIKPAVLLSYSQEYDFGYNVSVTAYYKDKCWLGALARYNSEAGFLAGVNILNYANLTYTVTFSYGSLSTYNGLNTIHQITLSALFDTEKWKSVFKYF